MPRRNRTPPDAATPSPAATWLPAAIVLAAALAAYGAIATNTLTNARLDFAETTALIKAWWYVSGVLAPFSAADALPTMPAFPYALGWAQTLIGLALTPSRMAMIALGAANAVLLFALCRKLTANTLASAAAVLLFIGTPATAFAFATVSPVGLVSLLHLTGLWLVVRSVGRPTALKSLAMGAVLALLIFASPDMALPALALLIVFMAGAGKARWLHGAIAVAIPVGVTAAAVSLLPEQFSAYLLELPPVAVVRGLLGFGPIVDMSATRLALDAFDGVLLPYGGTLLLCVLLIMLTFDGPRVFWVVPLYLFVTLAVLVLFRAPGCEICVATAPSQIMAVGALGAAMTLAFMARQRRQSRGAGAPVVIGGVLVALALNTFAPGLASRPALQFFPAEMLKQERPAAERDDIATLMRFIGQNVPPGPEPILLIHRLPALPYAAHMAGRRFPAASLNPMAAMSVLPAAASGARREAALAAVEKRGGWTAETLRRWVEREYDVLIWQEGVATPDPAMTALLETGFDAAATLEFRGSKLTLYKRKV